MKIEKELWGKSPCGKEIFKYRLTNDAGAYVELSSIGAGIVTVAVPDRDGKLADVVLGYKDALSYFNDDPCLGKVPGRYANRIAKGHFVLDGKEYDLPVNNGPNHLHGGPRGFQNQVWESREKDGGVEFMYFSEDGEMGYPGALKAVARYEWSDNNELTLILTAESDAPTIVNLTNHSYFNLSGHAANDILDETVQFQAAGFTPIDSTFMTWGEIRSVEGTPFDFRAGKTVGRDIDADDEQLKNGMGYDHNMVLSTGGNLSKAACRISDPVSGIVLEVYTTEPGIQFYTGNFLDGTVKGKHGIVYPRRSAICVETQHYPDSPNQPNYPPVVLRPGETYSSTCIYKFGVE